MSSFSSSRRLAAAIIPVVALTGIVGSSVTASAIETQAANVVPGADTDSIVVNTDSTALTVTVDAADASATHITGTVTNNSDANFTRAGPRGTDDTAGDIAPARLVDQAHQYYQNNVYHDGPKAAPDRGMIGGLLGLKDGADFGSSRDLFQNFGSALGEANGERKDIAKQYNAARTAGHANVIEKLTVNANDSAAFSVELPHPTAGERTDFDAAAFLICTTSGSDQAYTFVGYEEGTTAPSATAGSSGLPASSNLMSSSM